MLWELCVAQQCPRPAPCRSKAHLAAVPRRSSLWPEAAGPHCGLCTHGVPPASGAGAGELLQQPGPPGLRASGTLPPPCRRHLASWPAPGPVSQGPGFLLKGPLFLYPPESRPRPPHKYPSRLLLPCCTGDQGHTCPHPPPSCLSHWRLLFIFKLLFKCRLLVK